MSDATVRFVEVLKKQTKVPVSEASLVSGKVTVLKPLTIKIDQQLTITKEFIVLSPLCVETKVDMSHEHDESGKAVLTKDGSCQLTLWEGLKVGDTVRMLKLNNGQLYYVVERVGE